MKKIAVIGCSFSRWINPWESSPRCWPHSLSLINTDIEVYNYSMYVNSCPMQYVMALEFLKSNEFDAIIVQWTTQGRMTFILDNDKERPYRRAIEKSKGSSNYWMIPEEKQPWCDVNDEMMHFSPGILNRKTQKQIRKNRWYSAYETLSSCGIGAGGYIGSTESIKALQFALKEIAKKTGTPLYQMDWINRNRHTSLLAGYIDVVDLTVETSVKFSKYVVDRGKHFNTRGADTVAGLVNSWIQNNV